MTTKTFAQGLAVALSLLTGTASAGVYKCTAPGGKTTYQQTPCPDGTKAGTLRPGTVRAFVIRYKGTGGETTTMLTADKSRTQMPDGNGVLVDLDAGFTAVLDGQKQVAQIADLKETGAMAQFAQLLIGAGGGVKPTGARRTVLGYECDEYEATITFFFTVHTRSCVSKNAPGAAELAQFARRLLELAPEMAQVQAAAGDAVGITLASETQGGWLGTDVMEATSLGEELVAEHHFRIPASYSRERFMDQERSPADAHLRERRRGGDGPED